MSKKHYELSSPFALVADYTCNRPRTVFNDDLEEERYQAFKDRMMAEVGTDVAGALVDYLPLKDIK